MINQSYQRIVTLMVSWVVAWNLLSRADEVPIELGQGIMAGTITPDSAILQTRLTGGTRLVNGDLPGAPGIARFEYATAANFTDQKVSHWIKSNPDQDHIVKARIRNLRPNKRYYYRVRYGSDQDRKNYSSKAYANWLPKPESMCTSQSGTFRTLAGAEIGTRYRFVITTGWNYHFYMHGYYANKEFPAYKGTDKMLGYPALASIAKLNADFFVSLGDTVYYDHPGEFSVPTLKDQPLGGWSGRAKSPTEMRRKYHEQFVMPRWQQLFQRVGTYWLVDDHDYRFDDSDPTMFAARYRGGDGRPSHQTGVRLFHEQLPVTDPLDPAEVTYRTLRVTKDLQIWFVEGRFYRSPNLMEDGPEKTMWGWRQRAWLKDTLRKSTASFKVIFHPTALIGPTYSRKIDNHVAGFRYERDTFFQWLADEQLTREVVFIVGDHHWKYHARHLPTGLEEFCCGSPVLANSGGGELALPGDPGMTDSPNEIAHLFHPREPYAGFLMLTVIPAEGTAKAKLSISFRGQKGDPVYNFNRMEP